MRGIVKPFRRTPTGRIRDPQGGFPIGGTPKALLSAGRRKAFGQRRARFAMPTRNRVFNAVIATAHAPQPKTSENRLYGFLLALLGITPRDRQEA
jgi:hypothetical protein